MYSGASSQRGHRQSLNPQLWGLPVVFILLVSRYCLLQNRSIGCLGKDVFWLLWLFLDFLSQEAKPASQDMVSWSCDTCVATASTPLLDFCLNKLKIFLSLNLACRRSTSFIPFNQSSRENYTRKIKSFKCISHLCEIITLLCNFIAFML